MHDSSFGRLIGVLVSPGKTFRSIAERPTWAAPLVVLTLLLTGVTFLTLQRVDLMSAMREQMQANGQQVPPNLEKAGGFMLGCQTATVLIATPLLCLGLAGVFLLLNLFGGQLRYPTSLGVLAHALMPMAVSCLLVVPVVLSRSSISLEEARGGGLLPSNLAAFAPEDAGPRLLALLSSFDFFSIWIVVLLIIGYSMAARLSKTAVAATVLVLWALLVLAKVGLMGLAPGGMR
jgi:hypothetical protein